MSSFLPVRKPMVVLLWNVMCGMERRGQPGCGEYPAVSAKAPPT